MPSIRSSAALALLASLSLTLPQGGWAQQQKPGRMPLTPQQQEQVFPEQKALWLRQQRGRIKVIETAERCVSGARTPDAFKDCLRQQRQANLTLRRSHKAEMRALYGRYGIQLPDTGSGWKQKPGWGDRSQPQV
jgi:hypothetical protein